jgi:hypothetical protein
VLDASLRNQGEIKMIPSLCESCDHMKEVVSGKGSRFLLCKKAAADIRFHKYPPQPIARCIGYEQKMERGDGSE